LRVADNPALKAAMQAADQVLPLFIRDPGLMALNAPKRIAFLNNGLISLDKQLRARGGQLYLRTGKPVEVLRGLMQESGAEVIFAEEDYTPYARKRDGEVASELPLQLQVGLTVHHPLAVLKPDGSAYTVFTPFSKAWKALPLTSRRIDEQDFRVNTPQGLATELLPEPGGGLIFAAGEEEAQKRLDLFLEQKVVDYYDGRNRLDEDGTSSLSPYFRFGMLSARAAAQAVRQKIETLPGNFQKGADTWLNELIWREFYHAILYHFPHVKRQAFNQSLKDIAWRDVPVELAAWQNGLTGYPVVDASMRQLAETGWMHNRGRMIVASFLVKDLLINWQEGERWFMQHLVDGDIAANNGGWQWTAGVGTDAAPYFRIFNPVLQAKKFDPNGEFVRRWVPELKRLPRELIHEPWLMSAEDQSQYACRVGKDYPAPIVDHREARQRTLQAFKASKALWQGEER